MLWVSDVGPSALQSSYSSFNEPCSPGRGLLLFSSALRNQTGDMPRENCQTVPVTP